MLAPFFAKILTHAGQILPGTIITSGELGKLGSWQTF